MLVALMALVGTAQVGADAFVAATSAGLNTLLVAGGAFLGAAQTFVTG